MLLPEQHQEQFTLGQAMPGDVKNAISTKFEVRELMSAGTSLST
jgi:hypothetical protein